jgi:hypothetical protein
MKYRLPKSWEKVGYSCKKLGNKYSGAFGEVYLGLWNQTKVKKINCDLNCVKKE